LKKTFIAAAMAVLLFLSTLSVVLVSSSLVLESSGRNRENAVSPQEGSYLPLVKTDPMKSRGNIGMSRMETVPSSPASFSRHLMCKDHDTSYNPINPTTIFSPSDSKAECLSTVSMDNKIEFRWYYRSDSSKSWDHYWDWSESPGPGSYYYWCAIYVSGDWPGSNYPRAWKVDVYLDDLYHFSEYFEVTDGGLSSHVTCEDVVDGNPVNTKSIFYKGTDTKVHHYIRLDHVAYFNDDNDHCHDGKTIWYAPSGGEYLTYTFYWSDYKDQNLEYDYWGWAYVGNDFISIDASTPTGAWTVEFYLDTYYHSGSIWYGPIATTQFEIREEGPNHPPVLSDGYIDGDGPWWGYTDTTFQFLVKYTDIDGDSAGTRDCWVYDYDQWWRFDMDHLAGNPIDGEWFTVFLTGFSCGTHSCYFYFTDIHGADPRYPETGYITFTAIEMGSDLYCLPAGSKLIDPTDPSTDGTKLLTSISLNGGGQTVTVSPGQAVSVSCTYQLWAPSNPTELDQLFFIYSWTPSWPPSSDYYHGVYHGMPGLYPGASGSDSFTLNAPSSYGTYYLYWCSGSHYSIPDAVNEYDQELTTSAHAKIMVGEPDIRVEPMNLDFTMPYQDTSSSTTQTGFNIISKSTNATSYGLSHRVVIGFWNSETVGSDIANRTITMLGGKIAKMDKVLNFTVVTVGDECEPFINKMLDHPFVRYVESDQITYTTFIPNDPRYSEQWGPAKIKAPSAWDLEKGENNIVLAIIDSGVDYNHEDLSDRFGALKGTDIVNGDNDPMPDPSIPYDDHGTHVAGIAAATINNGKGVAGIAQVTLLAVKVLNGRTGWVSDEAEGIRWAADNGADAISISIESDSLTVLRDACQYAWNQGIVTVAASGNGDTRGVRYPAAYETVVAVGAINQNDERCSYPSWGSNYGPELELVAPGYQILSTVLNNNYQSKSGTSMATPHVSGVAALILSNNPGLTNQQVRDILDNTADDLGDPGRDEYFGFGRVDTYEGVASAGGSKQITVYNDGNTDLHVVSIECDEPWLSTNSTSFVVTPGGSQMITVSVDSAGLGIGVYYGTSYIYSDDPDENPVTVTVTLDMIDATPPDAPIISSTTHPDESRWYSNNDPSLDWSVPPDVSGIKGYSYSLDHSSATIPNTIIDTTSNSVSFTDLADGEWWFHVRAVDNADNWGPADHFRIRIDTTAPSCSITHAPGSDSVFVEATDPLPGSGIYATYVRIDGGSWTEYLGAGPVEIPLSGTGSHSVEAYTVDNAHPANEESPLKNLTLHYLTVNTNPSGLNNAMGQGWYDHGSNAQITVDNASGYFFAYWYLDGQVDVPYSTDMSTIVTIDQPHNATAKFIAGDVDGDRDVDAYDLFEFSKAYGSYPSKPNWNPSCDFNRDNKVDASDLSDLSKNYGKTI